MEYHLRIICEFMAIMGVFFLVFAFLVMVGA